MPANLCTFTATAATMLIRSATGAGEFNGSLAGMGSAMPFAFSGDAPASYYDKTEVDDPVNENPMMYIEVPIDELWSINRLLARSEVNKNLSSDPRSYHNTLAMEASQALRFNNRGRIGRIRGSGDPKYPARPSAPKRGPVQTKDQKEYRNYKYTLPLTLEEKRIPLTLEEKPFPELPGQDDDVVSYQGISNAHTTDTDQSQGATSSGTDNHDDKHQQGIRSAHKKSNRRHKTKRKLHYRDGSQVQWKDKKGRKVTGTIVGNYYKGDKGKALIMTAINEFKRVRGKLLDNPIIFAKDTKVLYKQTLKTAGMVMEDYDGTDPEAVVKVNVKTKNGEFEEQFLDADELCHDTAWLDKSESIAATTSRIPTYQPQTKKSKDEGAFRIHRDRILSSNVLLYPEGTVIWYEQARIAAVVTSHYYESMKPKNKNVSVKIIAPYHQRGICTDFPPADITQTIKQMILRHAGEQINVTSKGWRYLSKNWTRGDKFVTFSTEPNGEDTETCRVDDVMMTPSDI